MGKHKKHWKYDVPVKKQSLLQRIFPLFRRKTGIVRIVGAKRDVAV